LSEIDEARTGADLDLRGVAADAAALVPQDIEEAGEVHRIVPRGEEAVAVASGAPGPDLRVSADDHRHSGLLHGLRIRLHRAPPEELAFEGLRLVLPERADRAHRLVGACGAVREGNAERVKLLLQPPDADSEDRPTGREHVERGDLLGD